MIPKIPLPGTNRRDFIKFLALVAAGTSALPDQIGAFEKYYEANTPFSDDLVAVDEILMSGTATKSTVMICDFYKNDQRALHFGINAFGGIVRWSAMPDQKIIVSRPDFFWKITKEGFDTLIGQISFVDAKYKRHVAQITRHEGSLGYA